MKALVVDDDLTSRLVLEAVLCGFGKVDTCGDGMDAVRSAIFAMAQGEPYDVICLDINMPTMNGLEALQLIRQEEECRGRRRASKVIVVTGSDDSGNVREAFGQLCDAYLMKPVDSSKFLDILECLCEFDRAGGFSQAAQPCASIRPHN